MNEFKIRVNLEVPTVRTMLPIYLKLAAPTSTFSIDFVH